MQARAKFWVTTVGRSMLYGLCTTRHNTYNSERLAVTQRNMFRRMLRIKRKPIAVDPQVVLEPWVDWQVRSLRRAEAVVREQGVCVCVKRLLTSERLDWAGHVSRFGTQTKPQHLVKCVLLWRSLAWWKWQKFFNDRHFTVLRHQQHVGGLRRWEWNLPADWILHFQKESNAPDSVTAVSSGSQVSHKHLRRRI